MLVVVGLLFLIVSFLFLFFVGFFFSVCVQ